MRDPIGAYGAMQEGIKRYITSAFGTNSPSFEDERGELLDRNGVLFQEAYVEPVPSYASGKKLSDLDPDDLHGLSPGGIEAFKRIVGAGLFRGDYPLHKHQQSMLVNSLRGKHCVVVTGTGSGKTESFLLPVLANIVREATAEGREWGRPTKNPADWTADKKSGIPSWTDTRRSLRGESRAAAVRALVLYPMNALVEDQVSRLRQALDSDAVLGALDEKLSSNRIRFGRFNGSTPVSGHPIKDGGANRGKISQLKDEMAAAIGDYLGMRRKIEADQAALTDARLTKDDAEIKQAEDRMAATLEEATFIQRMSPDAAEMFHRWEMQATPPDILVTNISMLSIMLMRHSDPAIQGDRADADIFESTCRWLAEDRENNIFQLVIDELHLHRGSAGTEVAYLIRLLLERLGIGPDSPQLRILASSASLDGNSPSTYEFLGGFFGYTPDDAGKKFHVEAGELKYPAEDEVPDLGDETAAAALAVASEAIAEADWDDLGSIQRLAELLAKDAASSNKKILAAFHDGHGGYPAQKLSALSKSWFPRLAAQDQLAAIRGMFVAIGTKATKALGLEMPRLRFHWMAKNVEGLWATIDLSKGDAARRVGELLPDKKLEINGRRVLEVLYCECCGTQLLCGNKIPLKDGPIGVEKYELTSLEAQIEGLPETTVESRTDAQSYRDVGVVWLRRGGDPIHANDALCWKHGTIAVEEKSGRPKERKEAKWKQATIDPATGLIAPGASSGGIPCYWFDLDVAPADRHKYPAMPQRCPSCHINYSDRLGRRTPIRSFVTGLARMSHLFAKHLMTELPPGKSRKLVAFSDSREAAANLAVGVEEEQWMLLLRTFLNSELKARAGGGLEATMQQALGLLESGRTDEVPSLRNSARERFGDQDGRLDELKMFIQAARAFVEDPEGATADQKNRVERIRQHQNGYVHVDDILARPNADGRLAPLWIDFIKNGINPGGASVDKRKIGKELDWTSIFTEESGLLVPKLRPDVKPDSTEVGKISSALRQISWRALAGRLLYDLEAQGMGHLALGSSDVLVPPPGMPIEIFRQACESVLRILTEENNVSPHPWGGVENGWDRDKPNGHPSEGAAKSRVYGYMDKVCETHSVRLELLRDRVADSFVAAGHAVGAQWAVVNLAKLHVRVVGPKDSPWVCENCSRIHWHASAGICSRCLSKLTQSPNQSLTASQIEQRHYYAYEANEGRSSFRIHAEELTGQTQDQAQRQRHFRDIFFDDDEVVDIGRRNALRNVDSIDFLSVTTTMEVGVDIGSLQAVMQANMPPERFNYQQRVGRAGRKGQAFSAAFTFCRGQTHDRIHFEHPAEMTGGKPPQPSVSVADDQRILAERLVAKEILRRGFNGKDGVGTTWGSAQVPDTHGELGDLADAGANIEKFGAWLECHAEEVENVAQIIAKGTGLSVDGLISSARDLPRRMKQAVDSPEFVAPTLAHRLAEAGILPMFGMPTSVRQLYFRLPKGRGEGERDASTLDRPSDQAIADFAPGAQRTWDKRSLMSKYVTGALVKEPRGNWRASGLPIGAAYIHVRCDVCRQLHVEPVTNLAQWSTYASAVWDSTWLKNPPKGIKCPNCESMDAKPYMAVAPKAFATDMKLDRPAQGRGESRGRSGITGVSSPMLKSVLFEEVANSSIALGRQEAVYRTNVNHGDYFGFVESKALKEDWMQWPDAESDSGSFWRSSQDNPDFKVALTSPKVTDILAIRMQDKGGLQYFEGSGEQSMVRRRAAWYSAATILQRAIALELDVDSMDIEIASVHAMNDMGGAELYLADAHPNGAGLVDWAKKEWASLLQGCLFGEGGCNRMGRRLRDEIELTKESGHEWRSPDLLLRGFRNRQLHGLLDWELGIDLLASMLDPSFKPGLDKLANGKLLPISREGAWLEKVPEKVDSFARVFRINHADVVHDGLVHGWLTMEGQNKEFVLNFIVHPLWAGHAHENNAVGDAHRYAKTNGVRKVRRIDSFNLARRMAWVRGNMNLFALEDVDPGATASVPPKSIAVGTVALGEYDVSSIPVGGKFNALGRSWYKVSKRSLGQLTGGDWLAVSPTGSLIIANAYMKAGMAAPRIRSDGVWLSPEVVEKYSFVAKSET